MSDKFLGSSTGSLSNGTTTLFGSTIGALNLDPSQTLRTNSVRQIITARLNISDVDNLQTELDAAISNPVTSDLDMSGNNIIDLGEPTAGTMAATKNYVDGLLTGDVVGAPSSVSGNLCSFNGVTGKIIQDSLIPQADVFLRDGSVLATNNFDMGGHDILNCALIESPVGIDLKLETKTNTMDFNVQGFFTAVQLAEGVGPRNGTFRFIRNYDLVGGATAGANFHIQSTSHATRGHIVFEDDFDMNNKDIIQCANADISLLKSDQHQTLSGSQIEFLDGSFVSIMAIQNAGDVLVRSKLKTQSQDLVLQSGTGNSLTIPSTGTSEFDHFVKMQGLTVERDNVVLNIINPTGVASSLSLSSPADGVNSSLQNLATRFEVRADAGANRIALNHTSGSGIDFFAGTGSRMVLLPAELQMKEPINMSDNPINNISALDMDGSITTQKVALDNIGTTANPFNNIVGNIIASGTGTDLTLRRGASGRITVAVNEITFLTRLDMSDNDIFDCSGLDMTGDINMDSHTIYGDDASGGNLNLESTTSATKGHILAIDTLEGREDIRQFGTDYPLSDGLGVDCTLYKMLSTQSLVNSNAKTAMYNDTSAIGSRTIPAGSLHVGDTFHMIISGVFETGGNENYDVYFTVNAVDIDSTPFEVNKFDSKGSTSEITIRYDMTVRTLGATGTAIGSGRLSINGEGNLSGAGLNTLETPFVLNSTIANTLGISFKFKNADLDNRFIATTGFITLI